MITAIKAVYQPKEKRYEVKVIREANVLLAHEGFLVFDDAAKALEGVQIGVLIPKFKEAKKKAIVDWLGFEAAISRDAANIVTALAAHAPA